MLCRKEKNQESKLVVEQYHTTYIIMNERNMTEQ